MDYTTFNYTLKSSDQQLSGLRLTMGYGIKRFVSGPIFLNVAFMLHVTMKMDDSTLRTSEVDVNTYYNYYDTALEKNDYIEYNMLKNFNSYKWATVKIGGGFQF